MIRSAFLVLATLAGPLAASPQDKESSLRQSVPSPSTAAAPALPDPGGSGHLAFAESEGIRIPVAVVRGSPYQMGFHLGRLLADRMQSFIPRAMAGITAEMKSSADALRDLWGRTAAWGDDRVEQELAGLADGSGLPLGLLQAMHAVPLAMPYSCSSIAAWGPATPDGHLRQTRNLDWNLEVGAHEFPVITVYLPEKGTAHAVPSFAGMIGAHTGLNARGIALSEMGDSPAREMPYDSLAPHFTVWFRTMLYDADSLDSALSIFRRQRLTKRYHFVFGSGAENSRGAVKIRAHAPEPEPERVRIWKDNDPSDELAPHVLPGVVYQDEGRGAFPFLREHHGRLDSAALRDLACRIPIKGGNVVNVVYDATSLELWVTYAGKGREAYERPWVHLNLRTLDANQNGQPDLAESP